MKTDKPITIVLGEPNSVFIEILSKVLNKTYIKKKYPIILIGSNELIKSQLKKLKKKLNYEIIDINNFNFEKLRKKIYLIDISYNFRKAFEKISFKSHKYISNSFTKGLKLVNNKVSNILINGPISKKHFLKNKYPGITEYVFDKSKKNISKKPVMLIYNNKFSVSPLTTHLPLKKVNKKINQNLIINSVNQINNFYKFKLKKKPKIAILGLNPHCETSSKINEEELIIKPTIKTLRKNNINISGPYPADTFFLKKNISYFDSVVGMYHDQVLTPFKTIFGFNAANITLGMSFLRLSVDHGPNEKMIGKNKSNTESLEKIFNFIDSIR